MQIPTVSVCMPIRNGLPFLKAAVESALAQDYPNFDIVISLDPSTDGSDGYVRSLRSDRIRVVENLQPGLFSNLNNAIRQAQGDVVQVFCQDDVMQRGFLTNQVHELLENATASMVIGRPTTIFEDDTIGSMLTGSDEAGATPHHLAMWRAAHYGSIAPNISCVMFRREAIERVGGFDESYRYAGDIEFYLRIAQIGDIRNSAESHLFVRSHREQTSRESAASLGYLAEEERLYNGFWKSYLQHDDFEQIMRFRSKGRGSIHLRNAIKSLLAGKVGLAVAISRAVRRGYRFPIAIGTIFANRLALQPTIAPEAFRRYSRETALLLLLERTDPAKQPGDVV